MVDPASSKVPYVIGIDLGANSLGWAALRLGSDGEPEGLLHPAASMPTTPSMGVRIFEEGVEDYGRGEKEQSRAVQRRTARLARRQLMRRARRMNKVFHLLQRVGLLPPFADGEIVASGGIQPARDRLFKRLDAALSVTLESRVAPGHRRRAHELLPYALRAHALERRLDPHELGRALYHLAQRRGFLSNSKADDSDDERGAVKKGISELQAALDARGPGTTLGQYFWNEIDASRARIRQRWTKRDMYRQEFDRIIQMQRQHHAGILTIEFCAKLETALFHQRPLRSQSGLIGTCELESGAEYVDQHGAIQKTRRRRRAPECLPVCRRFRIVQDVVNLRVQVSEDEERPLTQAERDRLVGELLVKEELTKGLIKRLLGLKASMKLNLEASGKGGLKGDRTNAALRDIFGERWAGLTDSQRELVVLELWNAKDNETFITRAREHKGIWQMLAPTKAEASALDDVPLGGTYLNLSRRAAERLLPEMERGSAFATAVQTVYGRRVARDALAFLPPVDKVFGSLRNPAVQRALSELRRVVNTIIREYGKPTRIHLELARDLKKGKEDRQRIQKTNRENEGRRAKAAERITREAGIADPTGEQVLRVRLWDECGGQCPYTGRAIGFAQLFGGDVDIEHIIPYSRSLDDSYLNKTLCFADFNRSQKGNRTPFEVFHSDPQRYEEVLARLRHCKNENGMPEQKLERFQLTTQACEEFLEDFKSRQLNDTRYASLWAREYLMQVFGGDTVRGVDAAGNTRLIVGNGTITALVRRTLGIDRILYDAIKKEQALVRGAGVSPDIWVDKRMDHRHHAVDAVAIALTDAAVMQRLSKNAEQAWNERRKRIGTMAAPWAGFEDDVRGCVEPMVVSFRIDNRVRGPLHAETIYSPRRDEQGVRVPDGGYTHVRKKVESLTKGDLEEIVDPMVRACVIRHLDGRDPAKVIDRERPESYPSLPTKSGSSMPIRRVRVRKGGTTRTVGNAHRARDVQNAENHHLSVIDAASKSGRSGVRYEVTPLHEAVRRKAAKTPVVFRDPSLRCTIQRNDLVELTLADGRTRLCRVTGINDKEFEGCWMTEARLKAERERVRTSPKAFVELKCRKVVVTPIGVVHPCRA